MTLRLQLETKRSDTDHLQQQLDERETKISQLEVEVMQLKTNLNSSKVYVELCILRYVIQLQTTK